MLYKDWREAGLEGTGATREVDRYCDSCGAYEPHVEYHGYSLGESNIELCQDCALQLARKILEDLCELAGDRHG